MRVAAKVLLVVSVVGLVFVVLVVVGLWTGNQKGAGSANVTLPYDEQHKEAAEPAPKYSDPITRFQHLHEPPPAEPADTHAKAPEKRDLASTSEHEGNPALRGSEEPVFGADPPGPTLRPHGSRGTVVTDAWKPVIGSGDGGNIYTVQQGDTLYGIAVQRYGDAKYVPMIEAANPGLTPKSLQVGHKLTLPAPEAAEKPAPSDGGPAVKPTEDRPADAGKIYIVRRGDTLATIARRFYGDASMYRKIYEANSDTLSSVTVPLYVGQHLRMPEK
jgi:nucleoid-associated protein YgaU